MSTVPGEVLHFLADLESVVTKVIEEHCAKGEQEDNAIRHFAPFDVRVYDGDGSLLAKFYEEGIEVYPEEAK